MPHIPLHTTWATDASTFPHPSKLVQKKKERTTWVRALLTGLLYNM